jgi:hypothetical protein
LTLTWGNTHARDSQVTAQKTGGNLGHPDRHAGTDTERLVKDAALRLLEQAARFRAAVREGVAQAEREEFIEGQEMDARIERMLRS